MTSGDIFFHVLCSKDACDEVRKVFVDFNIKNSDIAPKGTSRGYDAIAKNISASKAFQIFGQLDRIPGIYDKKMSPEEYVIN